MNKILLGFIGIGLLTLFGCKNDKVNTSTSSTNTNSSSLIEKTEFYKLFKQGDIEKIVFVTEREYLYHQRALVENIFS